MRIENHKEIVVGGKSRLIKYILDREILNDSLISLIIVARNCEGRLKAASSGLIKAAGISYFAIKLHRCFIRMRYRREEKNPKLTQASQPKTLEKKIKSCFLEQLLAKPSRKYAILMRS